MTRREETVTLREPTKVKYKAFADLYRGSPDPAIRGNATACYKVVWPKSSHKTAAREGSATLRHPFVQGYLEQSAKRIADKADITEERILQELARMAFFDARNLYHEDGRPKSIQELDEDTARAIVGLDAVHIGNSDVGIGQVLKYKLSDKRGALELLGKHLRMFVDRSENTNITMSHEEWLDSLK